MIDLSGSPDLAQLSKAYEIPFVRLENMDNCDEVIDAFLAEDTSMILECIIDPMDLVAY
jgi:acetolactate synthase-1/2/3 large subunit